MSNGMELLDEMLGLRPAFADLVRHVCTGSDPDTVPLEEVKEGIEQMGLDRAAALVYAHQYADTLFQAIGMIHTLFGWFAVGRRPRSMAQLFAEADIPPPWEVMEPEVEQRVRDLIARRQEHQG